jgi:hypothetical protein
MELHQDVPADFQRVCRDCAQWFTIRSGERLFFQSMDLHLPTRCPYCCRARRAARQPDATEDGGP